MLMQIKGIYLCAQYIMCFI